MNPSTLVLKATLGSSRPEVANIDSQSECVYYFVWPVKKNLARNEKSEKFTCKSRFLAFLTNSEYLAPLGGLPLQPQVSAVEKQLPL